MRPTSEITAMIELAKDKLLQIPKLNYKTDALNVVVCTLKDTLKIAKIGNLGIGYGFGLGSLPSYPSEMILRGWKNAICKQSLCLKTGTDPQKIHVFYLLQTIRSALTFAMYSSVDKIVLQYGTSADFPPNEELKLEE